MKKKNEIRVAILLAVMMTFMNFIITPVMAAPGDIAINEDNFPDPNFRKYVKTTTTINKDGNDILSQEELNAVKEINVENKGITNLKGVELFTELKRLYCNQNQLKTLDLSKNINLETLNCMANNLTTLNLSENKNLTTLDCMANKLTTLDLSKNTELKYINCQVNKLTTLDLSNNRNIKVLYCDHNKLTTLDLKNNTNLEELYCDENQLTTLDLSNNPKVSVFSGYTQVYDIKVSASTLKFDLRSLPGNFVSSKASDWKGGTVDGNILTLKETRPPKVKYNYDVNHKYKSISVTLNVEYGNFVTVSFDNDGGTGSMNSKVLNQGSNYNLLACTFTPPAGKEFKAWDVNGVEKAVGETITVDTDIIVKALWKDKAVIDSIAVNSITHKTAYTKGEALDVSNLTIEVTMSDSTKTTKNVTAEMVSGFEPNTEGTQTLTITYEGKTTTYNVTVTAGTTPPTPPTPPTPTPDPYYPGYEPYRPHRPHKPAEDKKAEEKPDEKPAEKAIDKPAKKVETEVSLVIGSNNLDTKINGTDSFKGMDVAPYIKNARTMLPIRHVAEALGMSVSWDAKTRTVIIQDMFYTVEIPVDTNKIIVNGVEHISDVKPDIVHGRTMLPIANIARALGLKDGKDILWDAAKKQVTIIRTISR